MRPGTRGQSLELDRHSGRYLQHLALIIQCQKMVQNRHQPHPSWNNSGTTVGSWNEARTGAVTTVCKKLVRTCLIVAAAEFK